MTDDEKRDLIDRYVASYNAFDIDGMLALLHPDIVFRNDTAGETTASARGIAEFRDLAERSQKMFSARWQHITGYQPDGDSVTVGVRYEAVLAAGLPNGMKAGETLRLEGRTEFRFRDGQVDRIIDHS